MQQSFAIVPAAGHSRRMGRPKLLLPDRGARVIESVLAAWQASRVSRTIVVVRRDDGELAAVCQRPEVTVIMPADDPPEMKDSVLSALDHIAGAFQPRDEDVWLLAPADVPRLSTAVIDRLLAAYQAAPVDIMVPTHAGQRGHPVLLMWRVAAAVRTLAPDEGVNRLLERLPVRTVESGPECLARDLDTPDDYARHQA